MSGKTPWNLYEVVLLIDAYIKVRDGILLKKVAVAQLSQKLRSYGKINNIAVDEVYRNTNGINMRMSEIERLFNEGKGGLKNTSKLFVDTVNMYKTDINQFEMILMEAKRMTDQNNTNRTSFLEWLNEQEKLKFSPERVAALLDEGSNYAVNHKISKISFWEINSSKTFEFECQKLLNTHLFRVLHRNTAIALDKCYEHYKTFLTEIERQISSEEKQEDKDNKSVQVVEPISNDSEHKKEFRSNNAEEIKIELNESAISVEELLDTEALSDKLYKLLKSISDSNAYGTTSLYLATELHVKESDVKQLLSSADWATLEYGRYKFNYNAPSDAMTFNFEKPQSLAFTQPVSLVYFEDTIIKANSWRQLLIDFLKMIYEDYPHAISEIKGKVYAGANLPIVADNNDAAKMRAPKEFAQGLFVETNRSASDIMANLKRIIDACNIDYENVVVTFMRKERAAENPPQMTPPTVSKNEKTKGITIVEAASIVLQKADRPWTTKEIYNKIINENLYSFGAQDPVHVVEVKVNAACKGSGYAYKSSQELFGFIREDGQKKYYLLSRETEMVKNTEMKSESSGKVSSDVRTETDVKLAEKYPVLFKRIYSTMKEYGNISVSAQDVLEKVGRIARLSTVKHVLDYASWCEHVGSNYRYSTTPIQYILPDDNIGTEPIITGENEFYHWLESSQKLSSTDCSRFTSGIHVISRFLKNECQAIVDIYTIQDTKTVSGYFEIVEKHPSFGELAQNQKDRLTSSMRLYTEYLSALEGTKTKEVSAAAREKEKEFRQWLVLRVGADKARKYADALKFIEDRCISNHLIEKPFYEFNQDANFTNLLECATKRHFPFILQSANLNDAIGAIPLYKEFLCKDRDKAPAVLPKNVRTLNFNKIDDLSFTKPVRLKYLDKESADFSSWADLYVKVLFLLKIDHPRTLVDGTSLSGSNAPDISSKQNIMRAPKEIAKNLYAETNHSTRGLVNRIVEAFNICGVSLKKVEIQYLIPEKTLTSGSGDKTVSVDPQQLSKLMSFIKSTDNGVSFNEIRSKFSGIKPGTLRTMLDTENAVLMNNKYYHKGNIEDFEETAELILNSIQGQFLRNEGYTSAKMLYDELHVRLEDFFFDNSDRFNSPVEIYDLTRHLFEKIKYKGHSFIFTDNKHIWEAEPDYIKTYLGIIAHFAKMQNNIMTRDEMIEKIVDMGSTSEKATFSYLMLNENQNPAEKLFLMYDEYKYVLTEACHIDDTFLGTLRMNLEELFDGDDYLSFDDIDEYFYTTLPDLPSGVIWSPHMIKSVLAFFDVGFFTVAVGGDNDIKVPDAAIVRKNSNYKSFSDVLWSELNRDYELPKEFSAEDFRQVLLRKGFIHEREKMNNVHTTVEGDLRYFWTDNNSKVTVSKK